jgi:hypothetical protein
MIAKGGVKDVIVFALARWFGEPRVYTHEWDGVEHKYTGHIWRGCFYARHSSRIVDSARLKSRIFAELG